jgi:signal transduction histidine kinase
MLVLETARDGRRIQDTTIHLGISHACAGGTAIGVALLIHTGGGDQRLALAAGVLAGALVGLAFCAVLLRGLRIIGATASTLASGQPLAGKPMTAQWPLRNLIASLNALSAQVGDTDVHGQQAAAYHQELVRQVSEAAIQEERNRMARDLHDSIKQQIFSMSMSAATAEARWEHDPAGARAVLADIRENAREAQVEMEALLQQLRPAPLETMGLVEALRVQVEAFGYRSGAAVSVDLGDLPPDARLPPGTQDTLFRVAQEILANVARHARPRTVAVRLYQQRDALLFEVQDDGLGFDAATVRGGMGLANVRDRVRELRGNVGVDSAPGAGTTVRVSVPILPVAGTALTNAAPDGSEEQRLVAIATDADSMLSGGTFVASLGAILIFFDVNIGIILVCTALTAYYWFRAWLVGRRHTARAPISAPALGVHYRADGLFAGFFGLLALCAWYLPLAHIGRFPQASGWLAFTLSAACGLLSLIAWLRWLKGGRRYLVSLPARDRSSHIAMRMRVLSASFAIWVSCIVLVATNGGLDLGMPLRTADQWAGDAALALSIVWLVDLVEYVRLLRMQRNARTW